MRHLFFAVLFFAAWFPNCKKEQIIIKTPNPIDTIPRIIGLEQSFVLNNSAIWNASYKAFYEHATKTRFFMEARKTYYNSGLSEYSIIQDIPLAVGRYPITRVTLFSDFNNGIPDAGYAMSNYDEGIGNFYPDTTRAGNFIEVLYCDTIKNEVEGRFQVFMVEPGGPSTLPGVPDSIFLTEGKFYLKLQ